MMNDKTSAHKFLTGLEGELTKLLPEPTQMRIRVAAPPEEGKDGKSPSKIRENKFIYYALPIVTGYMQTIKGIGPNEARQSMLCEYHKKVRNSSGNPFRRAGHPFRKNCNLDVDKIIQS
jgi:hypothetical protein